MTNSLGLYVGLWQP